MKFFIAIGSVIIAISSIIIFFSVKQINVAKRGKIIKARLVRKGPYQPKGGSPCYFAYMSQEFSDDVGKETYTKLQINDVYDFYHWDGEPRIFINAKKRIGKMYFNLCVGVVLLAFGIFVVIFYYRRYRV